MMSRGDVSYLVTFALILSLNEPVVSCHAKYTRESLVGYRCESQLESALELPGLSMPECTMACTRRKQCALQNYANNITMCLLYTKHCVSSEKNANYEVRAFHPDPDRRGCITWKAVSGVFPTEGQGAVLQQYDRMLAVARGMCGPALLPGRLYNSHKSPEFWSANNGSLCPVNEGVETLIIDPSCSVVWVSYVAGQGQKLPLNAVVGGHDGNGNALYVARGQQADGQTGLGYYHPVRDTLVMAVGGEVTRPDMDILVVL